MTHVVRSNGSLEMRDEAGRTVRYAVLSTEQLQALQAECERLREQVVAEQERIRRLEREVEELRREHQATIAERDDFRQSLHAILRDQLTVDEAQLEAELLEAERTGIPAEEVLRELEGLCKDERRGGGND